MTHVSPHSVRDRPQPAVSKEKSVARGERARIAVVQDGARLHYALPVALQRAGILERVFTDWFVHPGSPEETIAALIKRLLPAFGRRLADRKCPELSPHRMTKSVKLAVQLQLARTRSEVPEIKYARMSRMVATAVRKNGWGKANALMGFVRNIDPDLCAAARQAGMLVVADQMIAPAAVQSAEERRQSASWPAWPLTREFSDANFVTNIEQRTWQAADHITCASDYVRDGLMQQGIPSTKISVIPYPIDHAAFPFFDRRNRDGVVEVGFVGAVGLRKGSPYFLEVARRFDPKKVRFTMVGPIGACESEHCAREPAVKVVGAVPRSEILAWLERFDVFFFPSTCEGSAGAIMEAMSTGLPSVTTHNSGSVVRDGVDGFVVADGNVAVFEEKLMPLVSNASLRSRMGQAARERALMFSYGRYSEQMADLFERLMSSRQPQRQATGPTPSRAD